MMCVVCVLGRLCRTGGFSRSSREREHGREPLNLPLLGKSCGASDSGHTTVVGGVAGEEDTEMCVEGEAGVEED